MKFIDEEVNLVSAFEKSKSKVLVVLKCAVEKK